MNVILNRSAKIVSYVAGCIFLFCISCVDSTNYMPFIIGIVISAAWLILYGAFIGGWMDDIFDRGAFLANIRTKMPKGRKAMTKAVYESLRPGDIVTISRGIYKGLCLRVVNTTYLEIGSAARSLSEVCVTQPGNTSFTLTRPYNSFDLVKRKEKA